MFDEIFDAAAGPLTRSRRGRRMEHSNRRPPESGFVCKHCGLYVSSLALVAGVQNRNHCPYCLWSRHLDLHKGGDRLSACKAEMSPVGLCLKRSRKKYPGAGELMLIHRCTGCQAFSINRLAADDDVEVILAVFENDWLLSGADRLALEAQGIAALSAQEVEEVRRQLFGKEMVWD